MSPTHTRLEARPGGRWVRSKDGWNSFLLVESVVHCSLKLPVAGTQQLNHLSMVINTSDLLQGGWK